MATLELTSAYTKTQEEVSAADASTLRLGIHDASRVEWSVSVPLPKTKPLKYAIEVRIKIPQNVFVEHSPWKQLQHFTRLDGPQMASSADAQSIDELRRGVLALANKLSRASEGFSKHCRLAASLFATTPNVELEGTLAVWIDTAQRVVSEGREQLARPQPGDAAEVTRERKLVDEYMSVRLLEMLGVASVSLTTMSGSRSPHAAELAPAIASAETCLGEALGAEFEHRKAAGYAKADPASPQALERYLDRASQLKKHFQEVLFLEQESYQMGDRISHVSAGFVALLASTWAFAWQLALIDKGLSAGARVGSGLTTVALVAGIIYATKDRLKELGRNFLARKLNDVYDVGRVTRYRAPSRRLPGRDVIVTANECFKQSVEKLPDPLNPESGASVPFTVLLYKSRGRVNPQKQLEASGVRRVKHVFRYDLSPLFSRLDDASKPVPVLCPETRKVRFIDAPRAYRLPMEIRVTCGSQVWTDEVSLVVHKRGLDRVERREDIELRPGTIDGGLEP